jgi:SPX domain protein involved in polyphosphate accumulation
VSFLYYRKNGRTQQLIETAVNIDYDYLKDLIRHQTSSGTGKAVSIPGQGGTSEKAFHDIFLEALKAQHDRITRFIRSKSGEIERRLEHIGTSLAQLQLRHASGPTDGRLPARVVERYAKIDADVNRYVFLFITALAGVVRSLTFTRAGEEIRSLSRFQVAQRTGFRKILKKYRRWTKDRDVESVFKHDITASPDSFYQLDLGHLLDQYIDVLGALRTAFNVSSSSDPPSAGTKVSSPSMRISQATQKGRDIDFDLALVLTPLGARGAKATYWIHPDHIVETEVLLLQHMRLHSEPKASTLGSSPVATRRPQTPTVVEKCFDNEDAIGLLVLDHPESFAIKQNASMIGASEETAGTLQVKSAGNARWTSSGDAAVVVDSKPHTGDEFILAQLKRKHIPVFLNTTVPFHPQHGSGLREQGIQAVDQASTSNITAVRDWLNEHQEVKPVAGICSKRTRFVGLHNNSSGLVKFAHYLVIASCLQTPRVLPN